MTVRFGIVGYGVGGRLFHAPYIAAAQECELAGILVRNAERAEQARADHPEVAIFTSLADMAAAGIEAVTVSTPPETRQSLVLEALGLGLHVIADKPFAPSAADARDLAIAAAAADRLLNVYHNRRFDSDVVTAREVIASGVLGRINRLDLRCDQDDPATLEDGPSGGLLRDLGSHVVDQALDLLGPARSVYANMDWADTPSGPTDVGFVITIDHVSGAHSHISSSKVNRLESRELRLLGADGSYTSDYSDVQFAAIVAGERPTAGSPTWGREAESRWGRLATLDGQTRRVPSAQGDYAEMYTRFAAAVTAGGPGPVPAGEGIRVLEVLDAARRSAESGAVVTVIG